MNKLLLKRFASWSPGIRLFAPLNIIGLNLLVSSFWDKSFKLISFFSYRKKDHLLTSAQLSELSKNGYVVLKDFLESNDFITLTNEIYLYQSNNDFKNKDDISFAVRTPKKNYINLILLDHYFGKNSKLHNTIEYLTKIRSDYNAPIEYRSFINANNKELNSYSDQQECIHKDVFYNSYKAILYMEDTNEQNGAFQYMNGSQNFSFKSFLLNFLAGLFGIKAFSWIKVKNDDEIKSINCKANSLIIMNAKGLHRRGVFKNKGSRKTLFIDFRQFHSLFNLFSFFTSKKSNH